MRKFFITDIHGELKGLELLLRQSELDWEQDQYQRLETRRIGRI
ncbi:hypothetical protein MHI24_11170 [Paenibacillus sp. FSL K6-1096]